MKKKIVPISSQGWDLGKVVLISGIVLWFVVMAIAVIGCNNLAVPPAELPTTKAGGKPPTVATGNYYNISTTAKPIAQAHCFQCHGASVYESSYPAGVLVIPGNPWQWYLPTGMDVQDLHDAVSKWMAPANVAMTNTNTQTLINHIVGDLGATGTTFTVPTTFTWSLAGQITGVTLDEENGEGYFHAIRAEDNRSQTTDLDLLWQTDNFNGYTKKCLKFADYTQVVYPDTFAHSDDPVVYVSPSRVAYNGLLQNPVEMQGAFKVNKRIRFVMHVQVMHMGPKPYANRDARTYVGLQVERDGQLGLRRKKYNVTDEYETVGAWINNSSSLLTAENGYYLEQQGLGTLIYERFYWIKFNSYTDGGGTHYVGQLWTKNPADGGSLMGEVRGYTTDSAVDNGGFAFAEYEINESGKGDFIADPFNVTATNMRNEGQDFGNCMNCGGGGGELDELDVPPPDEEESMLVVTRKKRQVGP